MSSPSYSPRSDISPCSCSTPSPPFTPPPCPHSPNTYIEIPTVSDRVCEDIKMRIQNKLDKITLLKWKIARSHSSHRQLKYAKLLWQCYGAYFELCDMAQQLYSQRNEVEIVSLTDILRHSCGGHSPANTDPECVDLVSDTDEDLN